MNVNGRKLIIEMFGDYWHEGDNPAERARIFASFGYQTLVVWEKELKDVPNVTARIKEFVE